MLTLGGSSTFKKKSEKASPLSARVYTFYAAVCRFSVNEQTSFSGQRPFLSSQLSHSNHLLTKNATSSVISCTVHLWWMASLVYLALISRHNFAIVLKTCPIVHLIDPLSAVWCNVFAGLCCVGSNSLHIEIQYVGWCNVKLTSHVWWIMGLIPPVWDVFQFKLHSQAWCNRNQVITKQQHKEKAM